LFPIRIGFKGTDYSGGIEQSLVLNECRAYLIRFPIANERTTLPRGEASDYTEPGQVGHLIDIESSKEIPYYLSRKN
jgi:hypothetical protein